MARYFDNNSANYLTVADNPSLSVTGPMTIHTWFYAESPATQRLICGKVASALGTDSSYGLMHLSTGAAQFWMKDSTSTTRVAQAPSSSVKAFKWQAMTGRFSYPESIGGAAAHVFIDGARYAAASWGTNLKDSTVPFRIGQDAGGGNLFLGGVAHTAIWNCALRDDEIMRLHAEAPPSSVRPQSLVSYWPLDMYPDVVDRSRNRNDLVMNGTVVIIPTPPNLGREVIWLEGASPDPLSTNQIDAPSIGAATTLYTPTLETQIASSFIAAATTLYAPSIAEPLDAPFIAATGGVFALGTFNIARPIRFLAPTTILMPPKLKIAITNVVAPSISGDAVEGLVLTASPGIWTGTPPLTYTYQWQRNTGSWGNITGATNKEYIVQSADVGNTLRVEVTATDQ